MGAIDLGKIIYVTGGARSGKSSYAENLIFKSERPRMYIATSIAFDEEMKSRVQKHREQRGSDWITVEAYKNIVEAIEKSSKENEIILLDCLTNLVSNNMILEENYDWDHIDQDTVNHVEEKIKLEVEEIIEYIEKSDYELIVVSNELGMGIVPSYPLGRYFRDICGRMNQIVAEKSDEAYLLVSGIPMRLK